MRRPHIALIGANSRIGPAILQALLDHPLSPLVVIFTRPASRPTPSHPRIRTVVIPSDPPTTKDLTSALHHNDVEALVSALNPGERETQMRLADACLAAGVSRYIPADYGSMRSDDPYVLDLLPNFQNKKLVREYCQRLAAHHKQFTWTSIATGHFFDYGLRTELLGINAKECSAMLFDGGMDQWSTSTTGQIGRAVAAIVLDKERETANQMLLIQSFCVSQKEVLAAMDRIKGRDQVQGTYVDSEGYIKEKAAEAKKGDMEAVEELVAVLGIKRSNWTGDKLLANELLGLEEEDLESIVREVLKNDEE